jgi:hypothetical protein
MEKQIEVSKELDVKVSIKDGFFVVEAAYAGQLGGANLVLKVSTDSVIDAVCAKISGTLDDQLGSLVKIGLKAI